MPEYPIRPIELDFIRIDGTQTRAALDESTVAEYAECYRNRAKMPPLVVFYDGAEHWLAEGFHRYFALRKIKHDKPVRCEVREGTKRDAIQYGFTANVAHGLRRTNADKRRAVEMALSDPEWENWTDNAVAELCGVTNHLVAKVREERAASAAGWNASNVPDAQEPDQQQVTETPTPKTRTGKDGKKYPAKQPKTPPKSEPVTEEAGGTDAPPAPEIEAWERHAGEFDDLATEIDDLLRKARALRKEPYGQHLSDAGLITNLTNARDELTNQAPAKKCEPCAKCSQRGFLTRKQVKRIERAGA